MKVVILGASENPDRFAYKAMELLIQKKHEVILVNPKLKKVNQALVLADLDQVKEQVNTLTMYVNAKISSEIIQKIINLNPARIIFNPGAENSEIEPRLKQAGIQIVNACTLVMLNTGKF